MNVHGMVLMRTGAMKEGGMVWICDGMMLMMLMV